MWNQWNRNRHYTVCGCGRWIWSDRVQAKRVCLCGTPFKKGVLAAGGPAHRPQPAKQHATAPPRGGTAELQQALQKLVASMPQEKREQFEKDFPILKPAKKKEDPFKQASARAAEAFREFKRLGDKRHRIESRAKKLQQELDELSEELAKTTQELDEAQERHEQEVRSYASVVQNGIQAGPEEASDFEYHPAWDVESDISGLAEDRMSDVGEGGDDKTEEPRKAGRFRQQARSVKKPTAEEHQQGGRSEQKTLQEPAPTARARSQQMVLPKLHWPANWVPENENFRLFKESLSDDQRAFLEGSWAAAAAAAEDAAAAEQAAPTAGPGTAVQATARAIGQTQRSQASAEETDGPEAQEIRTAAALLQALTDAGNDAAK